MAEKFHDDLVPETQEEESQRAQEDTALFASKVQKYLKFMAVMNSNTPSTALRKVYESQDLTDLSLPEQLTPVPRIHPQTANPSVLAPRNVNPHPQQEQEPQPLSLDPEQPLHSLHSREVIEIDLTDEEEPAADTDAAAINKTSNPKQNRQVRIGLPQSRQIIQSRRASVQQQKLMRYYKVLKKESAINKKLLEITLKENKMLRRQTNLLSMGLKVNKRKNIDTFSSQKTLTDQIISSVAQPLVLIPKICTTALTGNDKRPGPKTNNSNKLLSSLAASASAPTLPLSDPIPLSDSGCKLMEKNYPDFRDMMASFKTAGIGDGGESVSNNKNLYATRNSSFSTNIGPSPTPSLTDSGFETFSEPSPISSSSGYSGSNEVRKLPARGSSQFRSNSQAKKSTTIDKNMEAFGRIIYDRVAFDEVMSSQTKSQSQSLLSVPSRKVRPSVPLFNYSIRTWESQSQTSSQTNSQPTYL